MHVVAVVAVASVVAVVPNYVSCSCCYSNFIIAVALADAFARR